MEPSIFDTRASSSLLVISSNEVQESMQDMHREFYSFRYRDCEIGSDFSAVARRRDLPQNRRNFWQAAYYFASRIGGGSLDEVMRRFRNRTTEIER
jgi:hypothetical protein